MRRRLRDLLAHLLGILSMMLVIFGAVLLGAELAAALDLLVIPVRPGGFASGIAAVLGLGGVLLALELLE